MYITSICAHTPDSHRECINVFTWHKHTQVFSLLLFFSEVVEISNDGYKGSYSYDEIHNVEETS